MNMYAIKKIGDKKRFVKTGTQKNSHFFFKNQERGVLKKSQNGQLKKTSFLTYGYAHK